MNNTELKATRKALGIPVLDMAEMTGVAKRTWERWEAGNLKIPSDVVLMMNFLTSRYRKIHYSLQCIAAANVVIDEMPYFEGIDGFEDFKNIVCDNVVLWRMYQAVVSTMMVRGWVSSLNDDAKMPENLRLVLVEINERA